MQGQPVSRFSLAERAKHPSHCAVGGGRRFDRAVSCWVLVSFHSREMDVRDESACITVREYRKMICAASVDDTV